MHIKGLYGKTLTVILVNEGFWPLTGEQADQKSDVTVCIELAASRLNQVCRDKLERSAARHADITTTTTDNKLVPFTFRPHAISPSSTSQQQQLPLKAAQKKTLKRHICCLLSHPTQEKSKTRTLNCYTPPPTTTTLPWWMHGPVWRGL